MTRSLGLRSAKPNRSSNSDAPTPTSDREVVRGRLLAEDARVDGRVGRVAGLGRLARHQPADLVGELLQRRLQPGPVRRLHVERRHQPLLGDGQRGDARLGAYPRTGRRPALRTTAGACRLGQRRTRRPAPRPRRRRHRLPSAPVTNPRREIPVAVAARSLQFQRLPRPATGSPTARRAAPSARRRPAASRSPPGTAATGTRCSPGRTAPSRRPGAAARMVSKSCENPASILPSSAAIGLLQRQAQLVDAACEPCRLASKSHRSVLE